MHILSCMPRSGYPSTFLKTSKRTSFRRRFPNRPSPDGLPYIGKGKKDKLNKIDIVGFLYKKGGMAREDVGQVDVKEHYAFVAVRRSKMKQLLTLVRGEKIKGMKTVIEEAK